MLGRLKYAISARPLVPICILSTVMIPCSFVAMPVPLSL